MFSENACILSVEQVLFVPEEQYKENTSVFSKHRTVNELVLFLSGEKQIQFNDNTLFAKNGTVCFLPCGDIKNYTVKRKKRGECIDIWFIDNGTFPKEAFAVNLANNEKIQVLFKKTFLIWRSKKEGYQFRCMGLVYEIMAEMSAVYYRPKSSFAKIEPAVKYISENYTNENISIPYLAKICGISETYLKRLFTQKYGMSPKQYITNLKISYASELLSTKLFTVGQVAEATGYNNIYYFSKSFKYRTGVSPQEFMKKSG